MYGNIYSFIVRSDEGQLVKKVLSSLDMCVCVCVKKKGEIHPKAGHEGPEGVNSFFNLGTR